MVERNWGLPERKMQVDEAKYGAIPSLWRIVPVPICVGDD